MEFLFTPKFKDPTDVIAVDFCASGVWAPVSTSLLDDAKIRVNTELAHLTTSRITDSSASKRWDVVGLERELRPVLQDFVAKADPAKLSPRFATAIR
jgi:hypothetical protein